MKALRNIDPIMHKLLIENEMNGFSVTELRDASLTIDGVTTDIDLARRKIYRQIMKLLKKGFLISTGTGRSKRYFVSEEIKKLDVKVKKERSQAVTTKPSKELLDYSMLKNEQGHSQDQLQVVLGEIEEFQSLIKRFPSLHKYIKPQLDRARVQSAKLQGKINALSVTLREVNLAGRDC
ncbi:hypothetical protein BCS99_05290 [Vibrio breoganii]|nr:hypothetical protein BCT77_15910 [Vibrio breoganii]PMO70200.1 hypothetical protein BCT02_17690 [Vibrio breoganii]PMO89271.1 hypothetical protein BCS99_05290 [Vibrio breoganii]